MLDNIKAKSGKTLVELLIIGAIVGIGATIIGGAGIDGISHISRGTYTATVTEKPIKRKSSAESVKDVYMVFTKLDDGSVRVFENTDSWLELKWNSSDIQAQMEIGKKYDIKAYGWRWPLFSRYENVLSARPASSKINENR